MEHGTVVIELTQDQEAIVSAVIAGIKKEMAHTCLFSEVQRSALGELAAAIQSEGADRETHIIVLRIGKSLQNAVKKFVSGVVIAVSVAAGLSLIWLVSKKW